MGGESNGEGVAGIGDPTGIGGDGGPVTLLNSLNGQRLYREVTLALKTGIGGT